MFGYNYGYDCYDDEGEFSHCEPFLSDYPEYHMASQLGEQVDFIRPDFDIEGKDVLWCLSNGFEEVEPGVWSGSWYWRKNGGSMEEAKQKRLERLRSFVLLGDTANIKKEYCHELSLGVDTAKNILFELESEIIYISLECSLQEQTQLLDKIVEGFYYMQQNGGSSYEDGIRESMFCLMISTYLVSTTRFDDFEVLISSYKGLIGQVGIFEIMADYSSDKLFDPHCSLWTFIESCPKNNVFTLRNICEELFECKHREASMISRYFKYLLNKCPAILSTRDSNKSQNLTHILCETLQFQEQENKHTMEMCEIICQFLNKQWKEIRRVQKNFAKLGLPEIVFERQLIPFIDCPSMQRDEDGDTFLHYLCYSWYANAYDVNRERILRMMDLVIQYAPRNILLRAENNYSGDVWRHTKDTGYESLHYYFSCLLNKQPTLLSLGFSRRTVDECE